MLTKSRSKFIRSLSRKRNRKEHQRFVVEGYKSISELANAGLTYDEIYVTHGSELLDHLPVVEIGSREMSQISQMTTPPGYLAVFVMPESNETASPSGRAIILDGVSDPGNLGTIIRLADWYGIDQVICSEDCVDLYNSKTVQATMASIARVNVLYTNLMDFLNQNERPVYFADMHGDNIYENPLPAEALLVMGSESHGVSEEIRKFGKVVSIPSFSKHKSTESLNVAVATSILVSEWMRITGK